jgi:predicted O-methyltransferase YrrM
MADVKELCDPTIRTNHPRAPLARMVWARMLKPTYSVMDLALILVLLGALFTAIACSMAALWMKEYRTRLDAAVFESPLPDVQLAEMKFTPDSIAYKHSYNFTTNWFSANIPVWEKALAPYRGKANIHYLEVGVYEGRSALWTLDNILTHPSSRLTCIDVFDGPYKETFFANLQRSGESAKVTPITDYSQLALRKLPLNHFDIIYIDGSHSKGDVLEDAVLSWRLLKDGGIMIFDDYRWAGFHATGTTDAPTDFCKTTIDRFVHCFDRHFDVVHNSYQIMLRKTPPK